MNRKVFFPLMSLFFVIGVQSAFVLSSAFADTCSVDLNNKNQVVERLALLKLKVQGVSFNKSQKDFYNFIYEGQLKIFASKFGVQEEDLDLIVNKKLSEMITARTQDKTNLDEKEILKIIKENQRINEKKLQKLILKIQEDGFESVDSIVKGESPLTFYTQKGDVEIVQLLLERGADIKYVNSRGYTALHLAAFRNKIDVAKVLLEHSRDPDFLEYISVDGQSAIIIATAFEFADFVELLVKNNADVNARSRDGTSVLSFAKAHGRQGTIEYLIKHGAHE